MCVGPILGALVGVLRKPSDRFTFHLLSFAAGVMLSISFLNLIPESIRLSSLALTALGMALGVAVMLILDRIIPHIHPAFSEECKKGGLNRTALYLFLGITLHNFPEGLAVGIGSLSEFKLSIAIALAIAIHDIPEGICISAPYYKITGKRLKSFLIAVSTIIPTLAGLFFAHYLFTYIPASVIGIFVAATAGLMIYISGDELIPTSCSKSSGHHTIISLILGVLLVLLLNTIP